MDLFTVLQELKEFKDKNKPKDHLKEYKEPGQKEIL
jgi:hypothetical protein